MKQFTAMLEEIILNYSSKMDNYGPDGRKSLIKEMNAEIALMKEGWEAMNPSVPFADLLSTIK